MPPLARQIRRPRSPFNPQARGRAVHLQVSRVDHNRLRLGVRRSQALHHPREHTGLAPTLPPIIQRLVRAILPGSISPAQPITIDEHDTAQHPTIIHARLAVALAYAPPSFASLWAGAFQRMPKPYSQTVFRTLLGPRRQKSGAAWPAPSSAAAQSYDASCTSMAAAMASRC